jgi:hypothetical protein
MGQAKETQYTPSGRKRHLFSKARPDGRLIAKGVVKLTVARFYPMRFPKSLLDTLDIKFNWQP